MIIIRKPATTATKPTIDVKLLQTPLIQEQPTNTMKHPIPNQFLRNGNHFKSELAPVIKALSASNKPKNMKQTFLTRDVNSRRFWLMKLKTPNTMTEMPTAA